MWTHRRVTWHLQQVSPDMAQALHDQVQQVLGDLVTKTPQFFHHARVTGGALGILEFSLTVSDRDRWWVARRVQLLTGELRRHTDLPLALMSVDIAKPPPHPNRGKYRLRRLRRTQDV